LATVVQAGALTVMNRTGSAVEYKPWFISHALAFQISAACFLAGGAGGVAYLLTSHVIRRKRAPQMLGAVAPLETIERFEWWALVIGFPLFTYGILTGICELVRSTDPGPRAWLADPLVIASFITWGVYALLIASMWLQPKMRGRRAATMVTCGMGLVAMVFLVVQFVSPLHR
jgi:ABC-type transport system involved in cytochrome c biogenesis permease subunit